MSDSDAKIEIKVSDNKLKATATYLPPKADGDFMKKDDVLARLSELNVTVGINEDNIISIVTSDRPLRNIIVAEAISPQKGEKARIEPYFTFNPQRAPIKKEDGSVDFHDLGDNQ